MANGLVTVDTAPEASTGLGVSVSLARVLSPVLRKPGVGCRGRGRRQRASKGQTEVSHLLGGLVGKATSRFLAGVVTCRDSTPTVTRCPLVEGRAFRNAGGLRRCTCGIGQSGRGVPLLHVAEQTPLGHTGAEDQEPSVGPGVGLLPAGATQSTPIPSGRCQTSKGWFSATCLWGTHWRQARCTGLCVTLHSSRKSVNFYSLQEPCWALPGAQVSFVTGW